MFYSIRALPVLTPKLTRGGEPIHQLVAGRRKRPCNQASAQQLFHSSLFGGRDEVASFSSRDRLFRGRQWPGKRSCPGHFWHRQHQFRDQKPRTWPSGYCVGHRRGRYREPHPWSFDAFLLFISGLCGKLTLSRRRFLPGIGGDGDRYPDAVIFGRRLYSVSVVLILSPIMTLTVSSSGGFLASSHVIRPIT
jgi:hypothetical protein